MIIVCCESISGNPWSSRVLHITANRFFYNHYILAHNHPCFALNWLTIFVQKAVWLFVYFEWMWSQKEKPTVHDENLFWNGVRVPLGLFAVPCVSVNSSIRRPLFVVVKGGKNKKREFASCGSANFLYFSFTLTKHLRFETICRGKMFISLFNFFVVVGNR